MEKLKDYQGRLAVVFRQIAPAGFGHLHECCPLLDHLTTKVWAPPTVILGDDKALVTLENPPAFGLSPQIGSVILNDVDDKFIAQLLLYREKRYAESTFGIENVHAPYNEKFVQLELFRLPMIPEEICGNEFS